MPLMSLTLVDPKPPAKVDFAGFGLTSMTVTEDLRLPWISYQAWTQRGASPALPVENPVAELRRRSGLTWEQVAQVMGVERRTLHFWEAGRGMRPVHEERLQRILQVVRKADRGNAAATRELLLDGSKGPLLKDLLAEGHMDQAWARVASLPDPAPGIHPLPLPNEARVSRRDLPLAQRMDLLDDSVTLPPSGLGRPARVTRVGRK